MIVSHAFTWLHINLKKLMLMLVIELGHHSSCSPPCASFPLPTWTAYTKPVHAWEKYQFKLYHYDTCTHDVHIDQWPCVYTCNSHVHIHINANWRKLAAAMQYVNTEIYYCCSTSLAAWLLGVSSVAALSVVVHSLYILALVCRQLLVAAWSGLVLYLLLPQSWKQGDSDTNNINMATCNSCGVLLQWPWLQQNCIMHACNFAVIFGTSNIPSVTIISVLIVIVTVFNAVIPLVLYTAMHFKGSDTDSLRLARRRIITYINLIQAHSLPQLERRRWSQALFSLRYRYWVGHDASTVVARVSVLVDDACNRKMSAW